MVKAPTRHKPYIIETWMSNRVFPDLTFRTFEEARDCITEYANANSETEEDFNGISEDLYAVKVSPNGTRTY
jgi:hypothetical protein